MTVHYDSKTDLLYIRIEPTKQQVTNKRITDDVVLDVGEGDKIVGIEIMDASKHVKEILKSVFASKRSAYLKPPH